MLFNLDPSKPAQEELFSRKKKVKSSNSFKSQSGWKSVPSQTPNHFTWWKS